MDRDKLIQRLMATFLGELEEHVRSLNRDFLALEKEPTPEMRANLLKTLLRTAHSLKGASRSVGVAPVESACHLLEGIIADIRDGLLPLQRELFQLLFATVDGIDEAATRLKEQRDLSEATLLSLLPRLEGVRRSAESARPEVRPAVERETSPPPPIDSAGGAEIAKYHSTSKPPPGSQRGGREEESSGAAEPPPQDAAVADLGENPIVRIPAAKLDALLAVSGELLIARLRLEPRTDELAALLQFLVRWKEDWRKAERPLRRALDVHGPTNGSARPVLHRKAERVLDQVTENLARTASSLDTLLSNLVSDRRAVERAAAPLEEEVRRVRMVPFAEACEGLERAARDLAKKAGKDVELVLEGGDIELDRSVLAALKDPLLHLVRNAVDHGIETPTAREAAGKPARGRVTVQAAVRGDRVRIAVTDDGGGLDVNAVRDAAARRKLALPDNSDEAGELIFLPGFSTTRFITEVSGRGVGLDVVKSQVEALHGSVACSAKPGGGLSVILEVPLTLTTIRAVLISVGGHVHAIPQTHVQELVRIGAEDIRSVEGREVIPLGESPVPLASMSDVLGYPARERPRAGAKIPVVLVSVGEERVAFSVDELLSEQDVMVKNLGPRLRRVLHFSGATFLPSGRIALILNAADLLRSALGRAPGKPVAEELAPNAAKSKRLLVVDDSVTTRSLVKSILEAAGYAVVTAPDGAAAWQILQERGADLVVADVEMPRMDGCDLAKTIRESPRFRKLPVVLVTALDSAQDRARGMQAGADAYLVKTAFDQKQLLETIAQLV
jgi:two-component system, chemotaxis family, sensor kinase CheA